VTVVAVICWFCGGFVVAVIFGCGFVVVGFLVVGFRL
jgi:hypothetical protein